VLGGANFLQCKCVKIRKLVRGLDTVTAAIKKYRFYWTTVYYDTFNIAYSVLSSTPFNNSVRFMRWITDVCLQCCRR